VDEQFLYIVGDGGFVAIDEYFGFHDFLEEVLEYFGIELQDILDPVGNEFVDQHFRFVPEGLTFLSFELS
jgi:hypothetical protein